jgi:hypothetical protein
MNYAYELCHATITRTNTIKDLGVFFDLVLHVRSHVHYVFSECIKLLGLFRSITYRFSSLKCLYVLYFILVRSKLEFASVVGNSITSSDANKLERIQQKFAIFCFCRFFPSCSTYLYCCLRERTTRAHLEDHLWSADHSLRNGALEKLSLQSLRKRRHHLDALFLLFRSIVTLSPALPFWKMLAFMSLSAILGTSHCLELVPVINSVLLLGAPMLPTRWVKISTYL